MMLARCWFAALCMRLPHGAPPLHCLRLTKPWELPRYLMGSSPVAALAKGHELGG